MNKSCIIISGGPLHELPKDLDTREAGFVIACDKGWQHARRLGLQPDLALGDFDSSPLPRELPTEQHPSRKDDTDTLLAVKRALEQGCSRIHILCALGGRLDHSLANIQTGAYAAEQDPGARVYLYGEDSRALISGPGELLIPRREGWSLSLFSLSEAIRGLSLVGSGYDARGLTLKNSYPLGISNYWTAPQARIRFEEGLLLVLESKLQ